MDSSNSSPPVPAADFIPDETDPPIPYVLTDLAHTALTLQDLDTQVREATPAAVESFPARPRAGLSPAIVLVLGTGPVARVLLEAGAMPVELRADDANHEVWCSGLALLAERVDVLFATEDWNRDAGSRDAVLAAARLGKPIVFDVVSMRSWLRQREGARARQAVRDALASDADERL